MRTAEQQREEKTAFYYDDIYRQGYDVQHMQPVYQEIIDLLYKLEHGSPKPLRILEIGCGTGVFGKMVALAGFRYRGFDFSIEAIRRCPDTIRTMVARRNAYHKPTYRLGHNVIIAIETMEHLRDLEVLNFIQRGTACIFTLPNFTDEAHLRIYKNEKFIRKYYKGLIKWHKIVPIGMAVDEEIDCGRKIIHICKGVRL